MKTCEQIANHPMAVLHRDVVGILRARGSIEGAEGAWPALFRDPVLYKRLANFGLADRGRQAQLNRVAFPERNFTDVDLALAAGNKLRELYAIACGQASIARDAAGRPRLGRKGWKIIAIHARSRSS